MPDASSLNLFCKSLRSLTLLESVCLRANLQKKKAEILDGGRQLTRTTNWRQSFLFHLSAQISCQFWLETICGCVSCPVPPSWSPRYVVEMHAGRRNSLVEVLVFWITDVHSHFAANG
jgi:hypothetical protein